jgi:polyisoprenoid-binding protein YceI
MKIFIAAALALLLGPVVLAQHQNFTANPNTSEIKMTLNTTHEVVNGTFHLQSGSVAFDRHSPALSGSLIVTAASGNTGNASRDKRMDKEILKVDQFAIVSFAPKSYSGVIAPSGDSTIQVSGVFTLLASPHDLTIPVQIHIDGANLTARSHFEIPYVQWGLKNPSFLIWKAETNVAIDLNLTGQLSN